MRGTSSLIAGNSLRKLLILAVLLVVLGLLVYRFRGVIHLEGFSWDRLGQTLRQARGSLLLLSVAAIFAGYAIRSLRWMRFSRYLGQPNFGHVYSSTLMGFTAIFLLGRAGEPIRPLLIARKDRLPVASMFGIYFLERVFDTGSTAVLTGIGLLTLPRLAFNPESQGDFFMAARSAGLALLVFLLGAAAFLVYFRLHGAGALKQWLSSWRAGSGWKRRLGNMFAGFSDGLQAIRTWPDLLAAIAYSGAHWVLIALLYLWVPHSFGGRLAQIDFSGALVVLGFTLAGSAFQLPGVGGGSQVASFLALTIIFGVEQEPAAAASIVLWLVTFAASSLAGVPLLIREGWSMGELRRLARAEAAAEAAGAHAAIPEAAREKRDTAAQAGDRPQ